jgi:putative membrane protein
MLKFATYCAAFGFLSFMTACPAPSQTKPDPASSTKTTTAKHDTAMISDTAFARRAAEVGITEVKLGQLAEEKASSQEVKDFGKEMVADHTKTNKQLQDDAQKEKVTLPKEMTKSEQMAYDRLSKLSGQAFDRAYARDMVRYHKADLAEFQSESEHGQSGWTKNFASENLPTLRDQLKQAEKVLHAVEPAKSSKS